MPNLSGRLQTLLFRIILGFSLITLLFIAIVLFSLSNARQSQHYFDDIKHDAVPLLSISAEQANLLQALEPLLITLVDASNRDSLQNAQNQLVTQLNRLQQQLSNRRDTTAMTQDSAARRIQIALEQDTQMLRDRVSALVERQQQWIQTRQQFDAASVALDETNAAFRAEIDAIVYEVYDDYLISLIQEMSASANYGQVLIEKLKAAATPDYADQLSTELTDWIRDFDAYTGMLPLSIDENNDRYRAFLLSIADMTDTIRTTAQGEYDNETNDYKNGLTRIKQTQISLMTAQQDSLRDWLTTLQSMLTTNESLTEAGLAELNRITEQSANALQQQERIGQLSGLATLAFVIVISLHLTRQFRRSIRSIQTPLAQLAQGDLSGQLPKAGQDEFGQILHGIARVKEQLSTIVTGLNQSNREIHHGIENLDEQISVTRDNIGKQSGELDMVATALTEMAGTATEVAQHASDTHQQLNQAEQAAQEGRETVVQTRARVQAVDEQTRYAADALSRLTGGVDSINTILSSIQGIAEQTNLLALNAAIEAARAGEQGRGFAVVADEVRQLASRTTGATDEIRQMIETMQTDSNHAVEAMNQNLHRVAESLSSSEQTETTIDRMTDLMSGVIDLSHLIATASEQQAATVNEINRNIHQVSGLGDQTLTAADVMQQRSVTLRTLSDALNAQVQQFRT